MVEERPQPRSGVAGVQRTGCVGPGEPRESTGGPGPPRETLTFTLHHRGSPGEFDQTFALRGSVPGSRAEAGEMVRRLVQ